MANATGRPVAPARKLVAAVLGTIAGFVMVFGLGMSSWAVVALGAALLALAIALAVVNVARRGARAWIAGQGEVKAVSDPPVTGVYGRAELQLVVVAPGLPVTEVLVRDPRVPVGKWPLVGDTVPLTVDVDDMRRVRIDWDQAPDHGDDGDPPPPPGYEPPEEFLDDDLLGEPEPPPWATRDRQWGRGPDEPPPPPPPGAEPDPVGAPVVVHDTPRGVILEGQLVDQDDAARRQHRSEVLSDFPAAAAPSAAADFAAAPPSSAYPSQAEESPYTHGAAEPAAYVTETTYIAEPLDEEPVYREPARTAEPTRPPGSRPRPRPRTHDESPTAAPQGAAPPTAAAQDAPPEPGPAPDQRTDDAAASTPHAAATSADPEIDLPLDGDPEPPPESTPQARSAVDSDIIAPPADEPPTRDEPPTITGIDAPSDTAAEAPPLHTTGAPSSGAAAEAPPSRTEDDSTPERSGHGPAAAAAAAGVAAGLAGAHAVSRDDATHPARSNPGRPPTTGTDQHQPETGPDEAADHPATPSTAPAGAHPITPQAAAAMAATRAEPSTDPGPPAPHISPTGPGRPWADLENGGYEPDERADDLITAYPSARPGPAGAIHGVGITVLVTDLDRAVAFYRDTLGFFEIDHGPDSAVLASGDTRLVLHATENLSPEAARMVHLNLEVGDVEAVHDELRAKGVTFTHAPRPVNRGGKLELWAATFADPDGHTVAITQWRAVR